MSAEFVEEAIVDGTTGVAELAKRKRTCSDVLLQNGIAALLHIYLVGQYGVRGCHCGRQPKKTGAPCAEGSARSATNG